MVVSIISFMLSLCFLHEGRTTGFWHLFHRLSAKAQKKLGIWTEWLEPGPEVIKLFSYSAQLSTKFILLINVKILTIAGILTYIRTINTQFESFKG